MDEKVVEEEMEEVARQIFNGRKKITNFDNSLTHSKNAIFSKKKKKGHVENDCLFKGKLQFSIINKIWVC